MLIMIVALSFMMVYMYVNCCSVKAHLNRLEYRVEQLEDRLGVFYNED